MDHLARQTLYTSFQTIRITKPIKKASHYMNEINDTIQETVEEAGKSRINSKVAIFVAITATFMALCNVKDGNIVQAMDQAQAHSIDAWSYFQAKSTKQALAENTLEILKGQKAPGNDS